MRDISGNDISGNDISGNSEAAVYIKSYRYSFIMNLAMSIIEYWNILRLTYWFTLTNLLTWATVQTDATCNSQTDGWRTVHNSPTGKVTAYNSQIARLTAYN